MAAGKVFISTFAASQCAFGQGSAAQGWKSQFVDQLTGPNTVFFFVDTATFGTYTGVTNGQFNVSIGDYACIYADL